MRRAAFPAVLVLSAIAGYACQSSGGSTPAPAPAPTPAAAPAAQGAAGAGAQAPGRGAAAAPAQAGAAGAAAAGAPAGPPGAGAGRGGRGGPPLTPEQRAARRDSISKLREATVQKLMATIAGRENEPAGTVFKNVQLMKNVPAGQFLTAMDKGIGAGVGRGCTECHLETDWASDTLPRKRTTRFMMEMVAGINSQWLSRRPGRGGTPPTISCVTCHRGGGGAVAQNTQIIP